MWNWSSLLFIKCCICFARNSRFVYSKLFFLFFFGQSSLVLIQTSTKLAMYLCSASQIAINKYNKMEMSVLVIYWKSIYLIYYNIETTYMVYKFSHHAVPLASALLYCSILPILHQLDLVMESKNSGELTQQVHTIALEAIITTERFIRLLKHHIGLFLY